MRRDEMARRRTIRSAPARSNATQTSNACEAARPRHSDTRMAARDLEHRAIERAEIELVSAEQFRLGHAVEAGGNERLVHLRRIGAALIRLVLLRAQLRDQRGRPRDDRFCRELGSGAAIARRGQRPARRASSVHRLAVRLVDRLPHAPRRAGMSMRSCRAGFSASITALMTTAARRSCRTRRCP